MRTWPALDVAGIADEADLVQAALLDYNVAAIDEQTADRWRVFFATPDDRAAAAARLPRQFPGLTVESHDIADEDWAARSQAALRAVQVGGITVAPPWDAGEVGPGFSRTGAIVIVIQPSMGFGTGHHATTRLCLAALQELDLRGKRVLDVGTGSGVLAITASRLGAARVLAIDDDPDAIASATENVGLNPGVDVELRTASLLDGVLAPNEVVTANLTGALLIRASERLRDLVAPDGTLVISGFLAGEQRAVLASYKDFVLASRAEEDGWVAVTLTR